MKNKKIYPSLELKDTMLLQKIFRAFLERGVSYDAAKNLFTVWDKQSKWRVSAEAVSSIMNIKALSMLHNRRYFSFSTVENHWRCNTCDSLILSGQTVDLGIWEHFDLLHPEILVIFKLKEISPEGKNEKT